MTTWDNRPKLNALKAFIRLSAAVVDQSNQLSQAYQFCQNYAQSHSENFSIASFFIPKGLRQDFYVLYAYCRYCDDLADEQASSEQSLAALKDWRKQLGQGLEGGPTSSPILTAIVDTVKRRNLATKPLYDLLDAFQRDQIQNRYYDSADLLTYCYGSANSVGRLILNLARVTGQPAVNHSDAICTGLQLVNFCQDMHRDAIKNRIYMPEKLYQHFQVSEEMILAGKPTRQLQAALKEWVQQSRAYFLQGWDLWRSVPNWLARDIRLFAGGGLAVCDAIAAVDYDVWTARPTVSKIAKTKLLVRTILSTKIPRSRYFPVNP